MQFNRTDTPVGRHSLLLYMVGIVRFLLLPVLRMPIYLASAVLLVAQGQRKGADTFWRDLAIAWSSSSSGIASEAHWISILGK